MLNERRFRRTDGYLYRVLWGESRFEPGTYRLYLPSRNEHDADVSEPPTHKPRSEEEMEEMITSWAKEMKAIEESPGRRY